MVVVEEEEEDEVEEGVEVDEVVGDFDSGAKDVA